MLHGRTVDGNKCVEVLHGQQRVGQLPDEHLQEAGGIVLLQLLPLKRPVVERGLEVLTQRLESETRRARRSFHDFIVAEDEGRPFGLNVLQCGCGR